MNNKDSFLGISVIISTFNEEHNVRDCLSSFASVDYPQDHFEIIVVDASDDSTPRIVKEFPNVKLLEGEKGFSQQKNAGINAARFDILAFTDADCLIKENWLAVINEAMKDTRIAGVGGNAYPPPETSYFGKCVACVGHPGGGAIGFDANVTQTKKGVEFIAGCNCAFRKDALQSVGGFDPFFKDGGEDVDISRRLRHKEYILDYNPEMILYHKPRMTMTDYIIWNIGVGITKYNLNRPKLLRVVAEPFFPIWSLCIIVGLFFLVFRPTIFFLTILSGYLLFIISLYILAKPYRLLLRRRQKIGIDFISILSIIPFLVYVRQICLNIGQLKKWYKVRKMPV